MTDQKSAISRAAGSGSLFEHRVGFGKELARAGYGPVRSGAHLELFTDLCAWTASEGVAPEELTSDRVAAFLADRRARGCRDLVSVVGAAPLLSYLLQVGAIPEQVPVVPDGPARLLLEAYRRFLETERGLEQGTTDRYVKFAGRFVASLEHDGAIEWGRVTARDVTNFVVASTPGRRARHAPAVLPALRSFLRFTLLEGVIALPLHRAVPSVAGWRLSPLPQGIAPEMLQRLLDSCDRASGRGRRDYAIMLLLSRLGLRAGEVVAMSLDDLDWKRGELLVHGKARREEVMPLPEDVGAAIADYLQHARPVTKGRSIFLRCYAPRQAITVATVNGIVRESCDRAGIARIGAHSLRHTAASMMLAGGAGLAEIGEALRQRSTASTAIYAKVDRTRLAPLARPWPGSQR